MEWKGEAQAGAVAVGGDLEEKGFGCFRAPSITADASLYTHKPGRAAQDLDSSSSSCDGIAGYMPRPSPSSDSWGTIQHSSLPRPSFIPGGGEAQSFIW